MAEEAPEEAGGGGSVLKKYGPLAAIVLLAQVVLAWFVLTFALRDNVPAQDQDPLIPNQVVPQNNNREDTRTELPYLYTSPELKSITANPAGTNASRFVMFTVQLGLVAIDHDDNGKDVTRDLPNMADELAKITAYDPLIKRIIVGIVRVKTVDELDGDRLEEVEDEIKTEVNNRVFSKLFPVDEENKLEVQIQEVIFSDIIIQ